MTNELSVLINWSGLTGGSLTAGHIHCCAAPGANVGVALAFLGLPSGVSGQFFGKYTLAAAAQADLLPGLNAGLAYVNLHNPVFPGGEIRANLTTVPEPSTYALMVAGLLALGIAARQRRTS